MSFYNKQTLSNKRKYAKLLKGAANMTRLSSQSSKPYIPYRLAENIFCESFGARNVSRRDCSVDAVKLGDGVGIKTFISGGGTSKLEKIAEFNNAGRYPFTYDNIERLAKEASTYRNRRLHATISDYDLSACQYHYIVRDVGKLLICECPMEYIDIERINGVSIIQDNVVKFSDGTSNYSFNVRKNTLFKAFQVDQPLDEISVNMNMFDEESILNLLRTLCVPHEEEVLFEEHDFVVLPLYSTRFDGKVPEKSGLNQWNASGRPRDPDEIYIPVPIEVHRKKPHFFTENHNRDDSFILSTTDGREFTAKLCQENSKGLMSSPNKALGKWLLRDKLHIPYGHIVTYEDLVRNDADTVIIYKLSEKHFQIALHRLGAYRD